MASSCSRITLARFAAEFAHAVMEELERVDDRQAYLDGLKEELPLLASFLEPAEAQDLIPLVHAVIERQLGPALH